MVPGVDVKDEIGDLGDQVAAQQTKQGEAAATQPQKPAQYTVAAAAADTQAQWQLLKDIEDQCVSHGRHPGEWDNLKLQWVDALAPATPYFSISDRLMKPLRPREVICELLACGLPVSPTAHTPLNNAPDCKTFIRTSKKLVAAARTRGVGRELGAHLHVAVERGFLNAACIEYAKQAREAVHSVTVADAAAALSTVAARHPTVANSIQLDALEQWLTAISSTDYMAAVNAHLQKHKLAPKVLPAGKAPAEGADSCGVLAEKFAQYLSNMYHQEVRAAKGRRSNGEPPRSMEEAPPPHQAAAAASKNCPATVAPSGDDSSHTHGAIGATIPPVAEPGTPLTTPDSAQNGHSAALAMLTMLQLLPEGAKLGYSTHDGYFIPLKLVNLEVQHGSARKLQDAASIAATASHSRSCDPEFEELKALYESVLWAPDKAEIMDCAWQMHVQSLGNGTEERSEENVRQASQKFSPAAIAKLRKEYYGSESARALLRQVALAVIQRIKDKLLVPTGNPNKSIATIKGKIAALELPPLDPAHPPPAVFLLGRSRGRRAANTGSEPGTGGQAGPSAKRQRVA